MLFLSTISLAWAYSSITEDMPSPQTLYSLLEPSPGSFFEPTKIYDRTGTFLLAELDNPTVNQNVYLTSNASLASRQNEELDFQNIPPILILTTVAVSDPDFWNHSGYSIKGLFTNEHPTIAQRLVNDYLLWQELPGLRKAIRERLLAAQITSLFGRDKILEWFINYTDYGNYTIGAADASKAYFNKEAGNLTLSEAAILAATAETPLLNPWDATTIASDRGRQIIQSMLEDGWISQEQAKQTSFETFTFDKPLLITNNIAPDFIDYTLLQLNSNIHLDRVKRGGFIIITTLDFPLQAQTECTLNIQVNQLQGEDQEVVAFNGEECQAARLLPTLVSDKNITDRSTSAAILVLNPQNGEILAMTSAVDKKETNWFPGSYTSNITWQKHPTGTAMTPLVYLTALTRGFTLATLVWDIPTHEPLAIPNPKDEFQGPMRLRIALANDYLAPALDIMEQVGVENVKKIASQFGIPFEKNGNSDSAANILINSKATLVELSQFYAAIANQGNQSGWADTPSIENQNNISMKPVAILSVEDSHGNVWIDNNDEIEKKTVTTPQLAYLLTHALSDKASAWQTLGHPNVLEVGFQTAVKQGKTYSEDASAWTIGFTPELLVGVWTGENVQSESVSSPQISSSLWRAIMQYASKTYLPSTWEKPAGITSLLVCDPSGMLPSTNCPNSVVEVYMAGTEPTEKDTLFRSLEINKETGLLATVFTPADFIKNKIFMDIPAQAMDWAVSSGFEVPPTSYDIISRNISVYNDVAISSPKIFSYISGKIDIMGTAQGEGFQYYRLQVGKGVNPSQWLQIGDDISTPVTNGSLIEWDTSGLDGLYAIQLTVVENDSRLKNTFTQVTVDNQIPELSIGYPQDGQKIALQDSEQLTIQVDANDNLEIYQLEIYIDNKPVSTLYQTPYAYSWDAKAGDHTLSVKVYDVAGNSCEANISFSITQ